MTVPPVVTLRKVDGVQLYETPPPALIVTEELAQTVGVPTTVVVIVGSGFTVYCTVADVEQLPTALIPVTVYVLVTVLVVTTTAPVVALNCVAGAHL